MKQPFIPRRDAEKNLWLSNFSNKLSTYATKYNLSAADVTDMQNSSAYFNYWFNYLNLYNEYGSKLSQYKNELKDGVNAGGSASVVPVPPTTGVAPTAVDPGIFVRASKLAQVIKSNIAYTVADGNDLGIEGADSEPIDINNLKPAIKIRLVNGGQPELQWVKKNSDGIEIYVDRGTGQFQFLAVDTVPDYIDTYTLPATGSAVWKYKAIYRYNDMQAGQWSDVVMATVTAP